MEDNIMTIITISSLYIPVESTSRPTFLLKNSYYYICISIMVIMVIGVIMVIMENSFTESPTYHKYTGVDLT